MDTIVLGSEDLCKYLSVLESKIRLDQNSETGLILEGKCGKTTILLGIKKLFHERSLYLECATLNDGGHFTCAKIIDFLSPKCNGHIYLIDNINHICPQSKPATLAQLRMTSALIYSIDLLRSIRDCSYHIIATAQSLASVFHFNRTTADVIPEIMKPHRLGTIYSIPVPDRRGREKILETLISVTASTKIIETSTSMIKLAEDISYQTQGFSVSDLLKLVRTAIQPETKEIESRELSSIINNTWTLEPEMLRKITSQVIPSSVLEMTSVLVDISITPPEKFAVLSGKGHEGRLTYLIQAVLGDISGSFNTSPNDNNLLTPSSGVVIYGSSGSGKTALALALYQRCASRMRFMSVSCASLVHKVVGESEKRISAVFAAARLQAPSLLLLDDLDAVFGTTKENDSVDQQSYSNRRTSHNALDRLLSTILVEIDGIESNKHNNNSNLLSSMANGGVIVVATCQSIHSLDRALIRPGRLEDHIYIPLPDYEERKEILLAMLKPLILKGDTPTGGDDAMDRLASTLAHKTIGRSPAELKHIVTEEVMKVIRQTIESGSTVGIIETLSEIYFI